MKWNWIGWMTVAALAAGCASNEIGDESGDARDGTFLVDGKADAFGVSENSPLAEGVLRLVNSATEELLDDDVALDSRASRAIIAHRDGADGQLGTGDDDLVETLTELDAIPWVGTSAFERLVNFARDNGFVDYATGNPEQVLPGPTEQRSSFGSTTLADGRLLIVGGSGMDDTLASGEVYDPAQQAWTAIAPMSVQRTAPTATLLDDGRVLVAGGLGTRSEYGLTSAEIWDPTTDSWSDAGTFAGGRYDHTATKLDDGRVVLIGGKSSYRAYTHIDVSVYDPTTNSWTKTGVTPVGVDGHTATLTPDGTVLIVGGYNRFNKIRTRAVMEFDPATDTVEVVTHIDVARDEHTAVIMGDELWILGGTSDHDRAIASVEAIDLQTYEVRSLPPMVSARHDHSAGVLPNGNLVALSGTNESSFSGVQEVDVWNPASQAWELAAPLQSARTGGATFQTSSGLLMVGGETYSSENPASTLYIGGPSEPVVQPPLETTVDWLLLPHFGERFTCGDDELVFHEASDQLICFKGRAAENQPIGTHVWTPNGWVELLDESASPAPPRTMHSMTYDSARGKIVLFGGQKRSGFDLDDVWEFDGTTWTEAQPADAVVPPRQRMGELVFDSTRNRSVLLPGYIDGTINNDMFAWDGTRWSIVPQTNNQHFGTDPYDARRGFDAAYDAARDRIVIYGGWANGRATPTMEFDGQNWSQGGGGGPGNGGRLDSTFDPVTQSILVAGTMRVGSPSSTQQHKVWRYDGSWSVVTTDYRFDPYQWSRGVTYTPDFGVVIGGSSLRQLGAYTKPNRRPTIGYLGRRTLYPNEPFTAQIDAADPDGHDLDVVATGLPDGAEFDADSRTINWTPRPDQGGEYTITVTASDGALSKTVDLNITVEGLITYPMLPTGTIDMSGGVTASGTVRERRRTGYEQRNGSFRITCDFTGQNPGRVMYTCKVVYTSRWPYDYTVVSSGQLRPDGRLSGDVSGYVESLQWDDYQLHITRFDVSWQQRQELWAGSGDYTGYLDQN